MTKTIGIILTYKHARFLKPLYQKLQKIPEIDKIIISNDESGDNIAEIAKKLKIPCYSHPRLGYGGNMKYGLKKAIELGGEYMIEIHGDGQYDLNFIKPALTKAMQGYDLVLGTRFIDKLQPLKDQMPIIKYISNILLTFIESMVLGIWVSEFQTGARIYSKKAILSINIDKTSNDFLFALESVAQITHHNLKICEVPARSYYGQDHTSISLKNSVRYTFQAMKLLSTYFLKKHDLA